MNNLIKIYINKLKKENIEEFTKNNNIFLNQNEIDILYNLAKTKYQDILNGDETEIYNLKKYISEENYNKLYELYLKYKKRYLK